MARNTNNEAGETPAAATEEATVDSRLIMIDVPEGHASGLSGSQPRNAVMRALASTGEWTRGEIAKEITKLQGKKVAYQIVYQATKNIKETKMVQRGEEAGETAGETAAAE